MLQALQDRKGKGLDIHIIIDPEVLAEAAGQMEGSPQEEAGESPEMEQKEDANAPTDQMDMDRKQEELGLAPDGTDQMAGTEIHDKEGIPGTKPSKFADMLNSGPMGKNKFTKKK